MTHETAAHTATASAAGTPQGAGTTSSDERAGTASSDERADLAVASAAPRTRTIRPSAILWLVFLAGVGSMAVEMCASRLLAPYYGSSTIVWANIIGLVLASLALGYWIGGRVADRWPRPRLLGWLVLAAAVLVAVVPFAARPFLDLSVRGLDRVSAGAIIGSLLASLALFVPPVTLLGMVTPFAIRLAVTAVDDAGRTAGRIFSLSTIGSLLGTFLPALLFIPLVGTQRTLIGAAALIASAAAILLGRAWLAAAVALAALLAVPPGTVKSAAGLLFERESQYQYIQVVQRDDRRLLYLNEGEAVHSIWHPDSVFTGGEWDMFLTLPALMGRTPRYAATLGNAGGTTARAFRALFPTVRIDGVEIDPAVSDAGRAYFGIQEDAYLRVVDADARPFLRSTARRYDLIMIDAYRQPYVPFYLATHEFFDLVRSRLRPGGAVALNVTTLPGDERLVQGVAGTLATAFPQVVTWRPLRFNTLVVGLTERAPLSALRARLLAADAELLQDTSTSAATAPPSSSSLDAQAPGVASLTQLFAADLREAAPSDSPWTDDRAPVEWLTDRMIVSFAVRGGTTGEELLPTAP